MNEALAKFIVGRESNGYFITSSDVDYLLSLDRFVPVLVRTGKSRMTCAIQYLKTVIKTVDDSGDDYVRDVSFTIPIIEEAKKTVQKTA